MGLRSRAFVAGSPGERRWDELVYVFGASVVGFPSVSDRRLREAVHGSRSISVADQRRARDAC
eukprot:scaffold1385_cov403-Prasinococcus_capsulatus_cf.AAC.4